MPHVKYILQNLIKNDTNLSAYKGYSVFNFDVDARQLEKDKYFNPNDNYFYTLNEKYDEILDEAHPLYFFELIPDKTKEKESSLGAGIYLLKFVNWAIYYHQKLAEEYSQKKRRKTNDDVTSSYLTAKSMAIIIESMTGKEHTLEDIQNAAITRDSKKDFELNPRTFIILCQLFARGWYDQHFFADKHKKGTIEFAHYVSAYIEQNLSVYNDINSNIDSNLTKLFAKNENKTLDFRLYGFHILVEQEEHPSNTEKYSYSISISQYGCEHTFYRYAQLHNERHKKTAY